MYNKHTAEKSNYYSITTINVLSNYHPQMVIPSGRFAFAMSIRFHLWKGFWGWVIVAYSGNSEGWPPVQHL
jgi:hypothetical protein